MSAPKEELAKRSGNALSRKNSDKTPAVAPVSKPVRLSVDIDPIPYRHIVSFCQDVAMAVGRVRVNHVWVMRALINELLESKDLQAKVIERVREKHGEGA